MLSPTYSTNPTFGPGIYHPAIQPPISATPGVTMGQPMIGQPTIPGIPSATQMQQVAGYPTPAVAPVVVMGGHLTSEDRQMVNNWIKWQYGFACIALLVFVAIALVVVFGFVKPGMDRFDKETEAAETKFNNFKSNM